MSTRPARKTTVYRLVLETRIDDTDVGDDGETDFTHDLVGNRTSLLDPDDNLTR